MITRDQFTTWIDGIYADQIGPDAYEFGMDNPYDEVENSDETREIRLEDGQIKIDWDWNGYGEQVWDDMTQFEADWDEIMELGLGG